MRIAFPDIVIENNKLLCSYIHLNNLMQPMQKLILFFENNFLKFQFYHHETLDIFIAWKYYLNTFV